LADIQGLMAEGRSRLSVVVTRELSQHQRCMGKARSILARPVMSWSLNVPIAFSALLVLWRWGGSNWKEILLEQKCRLSALGHSLSNT